MAKKVYYCIAGLFGLSIVTPLFCYADGSVLAQSGYLVIAGSALDDATASRLTVTDNTLLLDGRRVSNQDYVCSPSSALPLSCQTGRISIRYPTRFHQRWQEVARNTLQRKFEQTGSRCSVFGPT